jgi:hypothetical protein
MSARWPPKYRFEVVMLRSVNEGDIVTCPRCAQARPVRLINPDLLILDCDDHIGIIRVLLPPLFGRAS